MQNDIEIGGTRITPGTRTTVHLPVPRLYTHTAMTMPVHVIHGRQDGPRLFVSGAIHGDEIVGTEIIRRLIKLKKLNKLRGTLMAVPVVNVYAFLQQSRYSPDRRDLNRFFPGSDKGSLTSRLANTFIEDVVKHCGYGIDLHAGSNHRTNLPQIRADLQDQRSAQLAEAFQVPVIIDAKQRAGSLRTAAHEMGIRCLVYEAGEALRFDEIAIKAGIRGVLQVMTELGMLRPAPKNKRSITPLTVASTSWARSPASGLLRLTTPLGTEVVKNDAIGIIADPFGDQETKILAPVSGVVIGCLQLPLVQQGDAVIHIAHLRDLEQVDPVIGEFQEEINGVI
jgi:predicted deacylase